MHWKVPWYWKYLLQLDMMFQITNVANHLSRKVCLWRNRKSDALSSSENIFFDFLPNFHFVYFLSFDGLPNIYIENSTPLLILHRRSDSESIRQKSTSPKNPISPLLSSYFLTSSQEEANSPVLLTAIQFIMRLTRLPSGRNGTILTRLSWLTCKLDNSNSRYHADYCMFHATSLQSSHNKVKKTLKCALQPP